jgi:hypothetical protein
MCRIDDASCHANAMHAPGRACSLCFRARRCGAKGKRRIRGRKRLDVAMEARVVCGGGGADESRFFFLSYGDQEAGARGEKRRGDPEGDKAPARRTGSREPWSVEGWVVALARRAGRGAGWNGMVVGGWITLPGGSRAAFGKRPLESSPAQSSRVGRLGWLAPEFGRAPSGVLTVATSVTDWSPLVPSSGPVQSAPHRASPRRRDDTHGHVQADVASGPPGGWWCACTRVSLVRVSPLACCPPPALFASRPVEDARRADPTPYGRRISARPCSLDRARILWARRDLANQHRRQQWLAAMHGPRHLIRSSVLLMALIWSIALRSTPSGTETSNRSRHFLRGGGTELNSHCVKR